jgi:hypothetical protein
VGEWVGRKVGNSAGRKVCVSAGSSAEKMVDWWAAQRGSGKVGQTAGYLVVMWELATVV